MRPAGLAALLALGLAGCITVYDSDGRNGGSNTVRTAGAYLLLPFDALEDPERARVFHEVVVPALSLDHPMTNAGNEEFPWYCFGFEDMVAAEYGRRRVAQLPGGQALAPRLLVDEACAAG